MADSRTCGECGTEVPRGAPQGLCPRCLVAMGIGLSQEAAESQATVSGEQIGDVIGRFKLLDKLGEGGYGVVYVAEQQIPVRRRVALKVLKLGMDTREVVARFESERQALALMDHPGIAKVFDAGATATGRPYFAMELVRGVRITDYCDQHKLPMRDRLRLFIDVCRAVQHAHQKGIIHRDLKPSNILVTAQEGAHVPKVIDFGIAKAISELRLGDTTVFTPFQGFVGTPAYTSPEQAEIRTHDIDTRTDIYSLGVLLYELLTGQTPFDGKELSAGGLEAIRRAIREREAIPPSACLTRMTPGELAKASGSRQTDSSRLVHSVRGDLDWIVMKTLEKERGRRYETVSGLALDVQRYLDDEPVVASPPSRVYRFQKLVRRNRTLFATGGLGLAALVVGLGVCSWLLLQETRALQRASAAEDRLREAVEKAEAATLQSEESAQKERSASYATDMLQTQAALQEGNIPQALELLRKHRPRPGEADLRGFEWRHLWHQSRGDYAFTLPQHKHVVGGMTFSPNGHWVATWSWENVLRVWDLESRAMVFESARVTAPAAFSVSGNELVFGLQDGSVMSWEANSLKLTTVLTNAGEVVSIAANGKTVAAIDSVGKLGVWDLSSGKLKCTLPEPVHRRLDSSWAAGMALAPDGNFLALVEQSPAPLTNVAGANCRPGYSDTSVSLWALEPVAKLKQLVEHRQVRCLCFSPDGKMLAAGDGGGPADDDLCSIWLWDLTSFEPIRKPVGMLPVLSLAFSRQSDLLACGISDHSILFWDAPSLTRVERRFEGQAGAVWVLAFSPEGHLLASGSRDQTIKMWNLKGQAGNEMIGGLNSKEWGNFCFSADGKLMAAGCKDKTVKVWNEETLQVLHVLPGASYAAGFSAEGKLLTSSDDELPRWWDLASEKSAPVLAYPQKLEGAVPCVDLSPDRRTAALGFKNGSIQILDIETQRVLGTYKEAHLGGVECLSFSSRGDMLVSGGRDKSVALWNVRQEQKACRFELSGTNAEHKGSVCAVAISPNGKFIATGCSAGTLKFWDPGDSLQKSLTTLAYHNSVIRTLCFSPDNLTLASGSEDNTVKLWNVRTFQLVASYNLGAHIQLVLFSPDGNTLAVVTEKGRLHLLRANSREQADSEIAVLSR